MKSYVSQQDWVDAIMKLFFNLDDNGKQELFNEIESDIYYMEPTREKLESNIEELNNTIEELQEENSELRLNLKEE